MKMYSVGRRVLVGQRKRIGTVKSVADAPDPKCMGQYRHEVSIDGESELTAVMGCDLEGVPVVDADLQTGHPVIQLNIQGSHIANLNIGFQVGTINAALGSVISERGADEFANAIKTLTEAVVSDSRLPDSSKREVVEALSMVAEQAAKRPEQRSMGILKPIVTWIPTAIATAASLVAVWEKFGPVIKSYLGL
jgi:hypothetical protein